MWYLDLSECRLPAGWGALVGEVATLKWLGVGYIKDNLETEVRSATKAGNLEVLDLRWTGARPEFLAELRKDGAVRVYYSSTHSTDD